MRRLLFCDVTQRRSVVTKVLGQPMDSVLNGQEARQDCVTAEDGTDRLSRNSVTYYQSTLCNIPEERRSHEYCCLTGCVAACSVLSCW
jgi:hypothetical protein